MDVVVNQTVSFYNGASYSKEVYTLHFGPSDPVALDAFFQLLIALRTDPAPVKALTFPLKVVMDFDSANYVEWDPDFSVVRGGSIVVPSTEAVG